MALLGEKPAVVQASRAPVLMTLGMLEPILYDVVMEDDGSAFAEGDIETATFYMRPLLSRTPVINGVSADIVDPEANDGFNISYQWQSGDTAIEGPFMGWWGIETTGESFQETPEFPILISDHGPGAGTQTGPVVDGIAQYMPVTFDVLRTDDRFGDRFLQRYADRAKREMFGYVDPPDYENQYDPQLIDYLAKVAAKHLILPAKDYWARQFRTRTTQSPVETSSYPDMLAALDQLHGRLCEELPHDLRQLRFYIPSLPVAHVAVSPSSSLEHRRRRTLDPAHVAHPTVGGPHWGFPFE